MAKIRENSFAIVHNDREHTMMLNDVWKIERHKSYTYI